MDEVEATSPVCRYNKFGFCKFKETCRMRHEDRICDEPLCYIQVCSRRHPKLCSFFEKYGQCKFGSYCRYLHKVPKVQNSDFYENTLKRNEEEILNLKEEISKLCNEINKMKASFENMNPRYQCEKDASFECDICDKTCKTKNGLKIHMKTHQQIPQFDGNDTLLDKSCVYENVEDNKCIRNLNYELRLNTHKSVTEYDIKECFITNINGTMEANGVSISEKEFQMKVVKERVSHDKRCQKRILLTIIDDTTIEEALMKLDPINSDDEFINWDDLAFENYVYGEVNIICESITKLLYPQI